MNRLFGSITSLEFASQVRKTPLSHLKNNNQNKQTTTTKIKHHHHQKDGLEEPCIYSPALLLNSYGPVK